MKTIQTPRAFPEFDPMVHVAKVREPVAEHAVRIIGLDFGSAAPCVAIHGTITETGRLEIYRCAFEAGIGLARFVAGGALGSRIPADLVAAEAAAVNRNPVNLESAAALLVNSGYGVMCAKSKPKWRSGRINERLRKTLGAGGIVVDSSCSELIAMFVGHREAFGTESNFRCTTPKHQHCCDALGYLVEAVDRWSVLDGMAVAGVALDEIA